MPSQDLKELCNAIVPLGFIHKVEENVVDGLADKCSQIEKFAVDTVESGCEEITLSRVFRVKQV